MRRITRGSSVRLMGYFGQGGPLFAYPVRKQRAFHLLVLWVQNALL